MASRRLDEDQRKLEDLSKELFDSSLNQRISRREALSNLAKLAGAAALSFAAGGILGYLFTPKKEVEKTLTETKTLTKTVYSTFTKTKTLTTTQTLTETTTKTITEKPTINIEVKVGKGYVESVSDVEILTRLYTDQKLDEVHGRYWNASTEGELNFKKFSRGYEARFFTQQEPGTQYVEFEVGKEGVKAKKQLSIDVGLSDEEIEKSILKRTGIKTLWKDLLESKVSNELERLEDYLRKENEIVNAAKVESVNRASAIYLRNLLTHLDENQLDYSNLLNGLGLILTSIPSRPWIVYGNFVERFDDAEYLIDGESAYLLARLLSEVEVGEKHVYAARAMVDQMQTIAKWLKVDAFDVLEYENKKLQLYDLAKRLFEKHLEFEGKGKRASVADDALIERWSDRSEINKNKHIYYGLRQCLLPPRMTVVDAVNRRYAWEDDPSILNTPSKQLDLLLQWIENYGKINGDLRKMLSNPHKKIRYSVYDREESPYDLWKYVGECPKCFYMANWPETAKNSYQDVYLLVDNNREEFKIPFLLYMYADIVKGTKKLEEVRVELASCYGSVMGYPIYREEFRYPPPTKANHGEPSFILNKEDEELLYSRSKEELLIEPNSYSLNVFFTRRWAVEKDNSPYGLIELPTWERVIFYEQSSR